MAKLEKQGMATGVEVDHPLTGAPVPVWVANFVLMEYGSGAVMSVPGHDQRDWEFATKYGLPIQRVVRPLDGSDDVCDLTAEPIRLAVFWLTPVSTTALISLQPSTPLALRWLQKVWASGR